MRGNRLSHTHTLTPCKPCTVTLSHMGFHMSKQKVLFIIRGLPGSGKSTIGNCFQFPTGEIPSVYSADDYFMVDGEYKFDRFKLTEAHNLCQTRVFTTLRNGYSCAVANTFTERWEMEPYILAAKEYDCRVIVVDCFDGGMTDEELAAKNIHGVPVEGIKAMRSRWQHDWRAGDTRPPWERK